LIICAPHGGREKPEDIPDRTRGTFAFDTNTQELVRAIGETFKQRSGQAPYLVICKLHRVKLDCNREELEGSAGQPEALEAWHAYHGAIRAAIQRATDTHGGVFLIDIHGHGHKIQSLEIGIGHSPEEFSLPDSKLNSRAVWERSTLAALMRNGSASYAELIWGPMSFGTLMQAAGFPSTPSGSVPIPPIPFFNGGYTVREHTARALETTNSNVAALQIETNYTGVRDTKQNQLKFADALFEVTSTYLKAHQKLIIPSKN